MGNPAIQIHGDKTQLDQITDNNIFDRQVKHIPHGGGIRGCASFDSYGFQLFSNP